MPSSSLKTPLMVVQTQIRSSLFTTSSLNRNSPRSSSRRPYVPCNKTAQRSKSQQMLTCSQRSSLLSVDRPQATRCFSLCIRRQAARPCPAPTSTVTRVSWRRSRRSTIRRAIRVIASSRLATARCIILSRAGLCHPRLISRWRSATLGRLVWPRISFQVGRISSLSLCRYQAQLQVNLRYQVTTTASESQLSS